VLNVQIENIAHLTSSDKAAVFMTVGASGSGKSFAACNNFEADDYPTLQIKERHAACIKRALERISTLENQKPNMSVCISNTDATEPNYNPVRKLYKDLGIPVYLVIFAPSIHVLADRIVIKFPDTMEEKY
jgi:hypothetical protein